MKGFRGFVGGEKQGRQKNVGIYVHVPFCMSKCHYCDFCSEQRADEEKKDRYVTRLCEEIRLFAEKIGESGDVPVADTVYFGGGTPTLLSAEQIGRVLSVIDEKFGIDKDAEITVETNPKSADREKLGEIRKNGVNRLSIGMQSVHDNELKALGRIHSFDDFFNTYYDARRVGFEPETGGPSRGTSTAAGQAPRWCRGSYPQRLPE